MNTSKNHNKKRNVGLLYEFLVRALSAAIVENDKKRSATALKLLKKYFKPGTELYKEFRLANALVKTTVGSEHTAASIIVEAKRAARSHDMQALDREKSLLIREINCTLNDENFFDRQIEEYKDYATVQQLFNVWRSDGGNVDLGQLAKHEEHLMSKLTSHEQPAEVVNESVDNGVGMNRLVMKLMMKRLNDKYSTVLIPEQKAILKAYAFSTIKDNATSIKQRLTEARDVTLAAIDGYLATAPENDRYVCEKVKKVKKQLLDESLDVVNDDTVTRFMLYVKLRSELESGDE